MAAQMQPKLEVAAARQAQPAATAAAAVSGAAAARHLPQGMGGQAWKGQEPQSDGPRIAFIVTTSDSLQQIRIWINYHRAIGVGTFYIFADGQVRVRGSRRQIAAEAALTSNPLADGSASACLQLQLQ